MRHTAATDPHASALAFRSGRDCACTHCFDLSAGQSPAPQSHLTPSGGARSPSEWLVQSSGHRLRTPAHRGRRAPAHSGGRSMERESTLEAGPMGPESCSEARQESGRDEAESAGKQRRLLCEEFSSVASCSASVARRCLAENDWEMEVRSPFLFRSFPGAARARSPFLCLFFRGR